MQFKQWTVQNDHLPSNFYSIYYNLRYNLHQLTISRTI